MTKSRQNGNNWMVMSVENDKNVHFAIILAFSDAKNFD